MMNLNKLYISRTEWGAAKGKLQGNVEFIGPNGKVELPLDEELSKQIVSLCADGIVRMSRSIATELTADTLDSTPQIEAPAV